MAPLGHRPVVLVLHRQALPVEAEDRDTRERSKRGADTDHCPVLHRRTVSTAIGSTEAALHELVLFRER